jgi:hypothetical protein
MSMGFVNAINSFVAGGREFYKEKRELEDRELRNKGERQRQDLLAKREGREKDLHAARKRLLQGQAEEAHNRVLAGDMQNEMTAATMGSQTARINEENQAKINQAKLANTLFKETYGVNIADSEAFGALAEVKSLELTSALKKAREESGGIGAKLANALGRDLTEFESQALNQFVAEKVLSDEFGATRYGDTSKRGGSGGKAGDKKGLSHKDNISSLNTAIRAMSELSVSYPELGKSPEFKSQLETLMNQLATETNKIGLEQASANVAPLAQTMLGKLTQMATEFKQADDYLKKAEEKLAKEKAAREKAESIPGRDVPLSPMTDWKKETDYRLGLTNEEPPEPPARGHRTLSVEVLPR